jgi:hypothetical protein
MWEYTVILPTRTAFAVICQIWMYLTPMFSLPILGLAASGNISIEPIIDVLDDKVISLFVWLLVVWTLFHIVMVSSSPPTASHMTELEMWGRYVWLSVLFVSPWGFIVRTSYKCGPVCMYTAIMPLVVPAVTVCALIFNASVYFAHTICCGHAPTPVGLPVVDNNNLCQPFIVDQ